eukprot:gene7256-12941_t
MTIATQMNRGYDSNTVAVRNEGIPIVLITTQEESDDDEYNVELSEVLPLPASKYRYTKWHEIEDVNVSSSALKTPRVRRAPLSYKKDTIYAIEEEYADNSDVDIESGKVSKKKFKKLRSKKQQDYRNKLEDWPNCKFVNLSYQELGHGYQLKEFYKVLRKLLRCQEIELMDNSLADLHTISFPRVFKILPDLKLLDGLPKTPLDEQMTKDTEPEVGSCIIS